MLIASFGLLVLGQSRAQLDGGVKYVVINLLATLLLLTGIGLLYGMTGTLNLADLHGKVPLVENRGLLTAVAALFLAAFGIKSALFPLFFGCRPPTIRRRLPCLPFSPVCCPR